MHHAVVVVLGDLQHFRQFTAARHFVFQHGFGKGHRQPEGGVDGELKFTGKTQTPQRAQGVVLQDFDPPQGLSTAC